MHFFTIVVLSVVSAALGAPAASGGSSRSMTEAAANTVHGSASATAPKVVNTKAPVANQTLSPDNGSVLFCTDQNYGGTCLNDPFISGQCYSFFSGDFYNDQVTSFQPSSGTCYLFKDANCPGSYSCVVGSGGSANLGFSCPTNFNDQLSSYYCYN